jgi:hypothetical protein
MHGVRFITELPQVTIEPDGVVVLSCSGAMVDTARLRRSMWRQFLEREIRALNEYERVERAERKVVRIGHH